MKSAIPSLRGSLSMRRPSLLPSLAALALLSACGGGGGGSTGATGQSTPTPPAGAPRLLYTDTPSAPVAGGENGKGGYLSIFGKNFGDPAGLGSATKVFIGGHEVAGYRSLGPAKVGAELGVQQLTVQVGPVGSVGAALPVSVVVGGVASAGTATFTPTAGRVLFVSLSGNDATAVPGDAARPWRHLQHAAGATGAYFALQAGDQVVIRGGHWTDVDGVDGTWMRASNAPRNGTPGAWIHITAYPGEDVHYSTPTGESGGIMGPWSAIAGDSGNFWCVSNLRMDVDAAAAADAAPINLQYTSGPWRVVNNELGPWPVAGVPAAKAAGVSGQGDGVLVLGNHIHDIAGTSALENHGIYVDTAASNWEVAWNWIHDITGGSLLQIYDSRGGAGTEVLPSGSTWAGFTGLRIHHNWLENAAKYGLTIADPGDNAGTVELRAWNNVILGTHLPPVRMNTSPDSFDVTVAFNTISGAMTTNSGTGNGYFRNEYKGGNGAIRIYDNLLVQTSATTSGTEWFYDYSGDSAAWSFRRNLYWGAPAMVEDPAAVAADPKLDAGLRPQSGSGAIDKGTQALPFTVSDDFTALTPRPTGAAPDLGAFEAAP